MNWLFLETWSPYLVGLGIGILSWISLLLSNKAIGCSTAYVRTGGMIENFLRKEEVKDRKYFQKYKPKIDWEWMLVIGIIIGSFISATLSGQFKIETVPAIWSQTFGNNLFLRSISAILGGVLIGFGSRLAGGCTSGHGISGTLQLSVGSWLALALFFIGGILTSIPLFQFIGGL